MSNLLTLTELATFVEKMKHTIVAASRGDQMSVTLSKLFSTSAFGPATRNHRQASGDGPKRRGRKPGLDSNTLYSAVQGASDGISVGELAAELGQPVDRVRAGLVRLRGEGKLSMKGEKRNARWYAGGKTKAEKKPRAKKAAKRAKVAPALEAAAPEA